MNTIARLLLAGCLCLTVPPGADGDDKGKKDVVTFQVTAPLVTSELKAETAAARGAEVVRAVVASEPEITERHAAHLSTRMGDIKGGGMIFSASCRQKFSVTEALAGGGRVGDREIAYSFRDSARGFPLPGPQRPALKGEVVVLVLGANGSLVKVLTDTRENRKEIESLTEYIKARPPAARSLLRAMKSFTLKIEYHGPKSDSHPSLWCTTNPKLPDKLAAKWLVEQNLSTVWAHQALDHLVRSGTLKPESIRAEATRPRPGEPFYSLKLSADGVDELTFHLGWGKEAATRIEALGRAMEYNGEAIAKMLAKLKDEGKMK